MIKSLAYLVAAFAVFFLVLWLGTTQPQTLDRLLIRVDVLGWTEAGALERQRLARIMKLPVALEKRQALGNRTVFLGATREMVFLALGAAKDKRSYADRKPGVLVETWLYYIHGDQQPTLLIFEDDHLTEARQVSTLDLVAKQP